VSKLATLNTLLKSKDLDIPDVRREVHKSGANLEWLRKHITKRNQNVPEELTELLALTINQLIED
jgi:hypothetical protein